MCDTDAASSGSVNENHVFQRRSPTIPTTLPILEEQPPYVQHEQNNYPSVAWKLTELSNRECPGEVVYVRLLRVDYSWQMTSVVGLLKVRGCAKYYRMPCCVGLTQSARSRHGAAIEVTYTQLWSALINLGEHSVSGTMFRVF